MGLYEVERDKISRTPQFIVELSITSCDNKYADLTPPSTCAATDAGNGSRCYYSFPTCQDTAHFRIDTLGLKTFKFCLKDAPLPVGGADIWPMLKSVVIAPQKIDPETAVTSSERVELTFYDDFAFWNWNQDKASAGALTNVPVNPLVLSVGRPTGTFWRRFMKIYRNYANPRNTVKVSVGFAASGAVEADFKQRGLYLIENLKLNSDGTVTMTLIDKLRLTRTQAPAKISDSNLLNGAIDGLTTSVIVDDGSELTTPGTGYTVTIMVDSEFMNVTGVTGNTLTVQRGRWGTSAASHSDNAAWKEVLMFGTERTTPSLAPLGKQGIDIVIELLRRAGIAAADIDSTTLLQEQTDWLSGSADPATGVQSGKLFQRAGNTIDAGNGGISVQQKIEDLIRQIREVAMLKLLVGEDQKVTGSIFAPARPSVTLTEITDNENIIKGSIEIDDNEKSRANIVVIYYDLIAGKTGDQPSDYQKWVSRADATGLSAAAYGTTGIRFKEVFSPWIRSSDSSTAVQLAVRLLGRFRNPARKIAVDLEVKDDAIKCGDFVNLTTAWLENADGTTASQSIMEVQSKKRDEDTHVLSLDLQDTGLSRRYCFIAPTGNPATYDAATKAQQRYGYIADGNGTVGALGDPGYYIWG